MDEREHEREKENERKRKAENDGGNSERARRTRRDNNSSAGDETATEGYAIASIIFIFFHYISLGVWVASRFTSDLWTQKNHHGWLSRETSSHLLQCYSLVH